MICEHCGTNNSDEAIFCQKCGKKLQITEQQEVSNQPAQKKSGNSEFWIVLLLVLLLVGGLFVGVYFYNQSTNTSSTIYNSSSNTSAASNTESNPDPTQIPGVIQQFCSAVAKQDFQTAFGLLSQQEQYHEKDASGLAQHLTDDFDTNYQGQHNGSFSWQPSQGEYTVTSCTIEGNPLVTQAYGNVPTTAEQHIAWTFSDNAITNGQFQMVYENGSWEINSFNANST